MYLNYKSQVISDDDPLVKYVRQCTDMLMNGVDIMDNLKKQTMDR